MILELIRKLVRKKPIYQIGTKDDYVNLNVLLTIVTEFSDRFGEHFHLLNWSLHLDESTNSEGYADNAADLEKVKR